MARQGLTLYDYVDNIKLQLGASIVTVEVESDIADIVRLAFNELKNYISDNETITVPYRQVIDLTDMKIANISYVMRSKTATGPGGFQDIMYIYTRQGAMGMYSLSDYARSLLAQQNKNMIATDLDFHYDKRNENLYIYAQQPVPNYVTLMYTPDYESVEEIIEPFWQQLLQRLSLALTKEVLGRVRGKYTPLSAAYSLDADKLLAEAQQELTEIRAYLQSNSDMLLPID